MWNPQRRDHNRGAGGRTVGTQILIQNNSVPDFDPFRVGLPLATRWHKVMDPSPDMVTKRVEMSRSAKMAFVFGFAALSLPFLGNTADAKSHLDLRGGLWMT